MNWAPLLIGLLGMGIVFLMVPVVLRHSHSAKGQNRSIDLHHTHQVRVPRLGGIALAGAFTVIELVITFFFPEQSSLHDRLVLVGTSLAMFGLGLWDDLRPLGAKRKLLVQVIIASMVCCFGIG